jgi:phosphoglycerate dehydrogenase-like enzyme
MADTRLLIFEPSLASVRSELAEHANALSLLVVDRTGAISQEGHSISVEAAEPHVAWASGELYESPAARGFLVAALKSPDLRWVQSAAAGYDNAIFAQIVGKGARLTTSHGQAVGMADYVLAGVLDHFQGGPERRRAQAGGVWRRLKFREIAGTRWLIVGFGAIGQEVARRAHAFGAHIVGVRRRPRRHPLADAVIGLEAVAEYLPAADVVVLCLPADPATRGLADAGFFAAMKTGAVLVNVGRGSLVDETALLAGLDRGQPGHAVLDVFATEPLPPDSPFWRHPGVSLTSHCSGYSTGEHARNKVLFLDNLRRFLAGDALVGEVDAAEVIAAVAS